MLSKPDRNQLSALARLVRTPLWSEVEQLMKAERETAVSQMLVATDEVRMRQLQGTAIALDNLLRLFEETRHSGE